MSIAISAVVKPSRLLLVIVVHMCIVNICIAAMVILKKNAESSQGIQLLIMTICVFSITSAVYWVIWKRKTFRIDISGDGQIRLMEDSGLIRLASLKQELNSSNSEKVVRLMPSSTCWPSLLLLRLEDESRQVTILPIFRDCIASNGFRSLSVACRWIAAHNIQANDKLSD